MDHDHKFSTKTPAAQRIRQNLTLDPKTVEEKRKLSEKLAEEELAKLLPDKPAPKKRQKQTKKKKQSVLFSMDEKVNPN
jgi:hypothetical protein